MLDTAVLFGKSETTLTIVAKKRHQVVMGELGPYVYKWHTNTSLI